MMYTYDDLRFYEWMLAEAKKRESKQVLDVIEERVVEIKKQIRTRNKKTSDKTVVHDDGDYYILKFPLPEYIDSKEDAVEYFKEYEYIYYRPTYYDCTGQHFTSWYKIFQKPDGRFWAYHAIGIDC